MVFGVAFGVARTTRCPGREATRGRRIAEDFPRGFGLLPRLLRLRRPDNEWSGPPGIDFIRGPTASLLPRYPGPEIGFLPKQGLAVPPSSWHRDSWAAAIGPAEALRQRGAVRFPIKTTRTNPDGNHPESAGREESAATVYHDGMYTIFEDPGGRSAFTPGPGLLGAARLAVGHRPSRGFRRRHELRERPATRRRRRGFGLGFRRGIAHRDDRVEVNHLFFGPPPSGRAGGPPPAR